MQYEFSTLELSTIENEAAETHIQRLNVSQERDKELQRIRAAEESSLPAADDDRLAASFEGALRLTVQGSQEILLTPEQVSHPACCLTHAPRILREPYFCSPFAPGPGYL